MLSRIPFTIGDLRIARTLALAALLAGMSAPQVEPLTLVTEDGVTVYGELYRAAASADAPVVLLFHQGRGSSAEYPVIATRLMAAGYHAVAVDQRRGGDMFGRLNRTLAGAGEARASSYCDVYADLEATLGAARERGFTGPAIAWGSSYSAALVLRLAIEHPDDIAAVASFSPASGEPMAGCEPEPWAERLEQPWFVARPARELETGWIAEQFELFRGLGATTLTAIDAHHGSSMLVPERNAASTEPAWRALADFLYTHVPAPGRGVTLDVDGWELVGDLTLPLTSGPYPAALLLHNAAGSRDEQEALAIELARRGIASLRLDLRGHGDSVNRGRFDPDDLEGTRHMIVDARVDVRAAITALPRLGDIAPTRIAVVGASYTGEAMAAAARDMNRYAAAYVAMSPGNFSDESIAAIDTSGADWLLLRSRVELPFFDELFAEIAAGSSAEIRVVPGSRHGTRILASPGLVEQVADWIEARIGEPRQGME
jgi:dienelactone hydrolase